MHLHVFNYEKTEYNIFIGRNAKNNWELFDKSDPNDVLFHVSNGPSSYVILHNKDKLKINQIPKQVIKRCACLCKSHSTSKSFKNVQISFTMIKNCEKSKKLGSVIMSNTLECIL